MSATFFPTDESHFKYKHDETTDSVIPLTMTHLLSHKLHLVYEMENILAYEEINIPDEQITA